MSLSPGQESMRNIWQIVRQPKTPSFSKRRRDAPKVESQFFLNLLSRNIDKAYANHCGDQKDYVEPAVVEFKLQVAEHFGDNGTILLGHVHTHQENGGDKVHSHQFGQRKYDDVRRFGRGDGVEKLDWIQE